MRGTPNWTAYAAAALTHELGQTSGDPYKAAARHADRMMQEVGPEAVQADAKSEPPAKENQQPPNPPKKRGRPRKVKE